MHIAPPLRSLRLSTQRLELRPTEPTDAQRAFEIQSDWDVTRMIALATWPPDVDELAKWFDIHPREWSDGKAYRFAIEHSARFIGVVDLDGVTESDASLGYWLERRAWGNGFASEAAKAVVDFALGHLRLQSLRASHAVDNPASGRVLESLGFRHIGNTRLHSRPRRTEIVQRLFILDAQVAT